MNDLIMIVEDDPYISHFLQMSFEQEGYRILMTSQGHEALSLFYSHQPDIVILDLGLPDMDGLEIIEEIRKISAKPIIMVTAKGEVFDKVLGLELGADDYMEKPFDSKELVARVKAVLRRYKPAAAEPKAPDVKSVEYPDLIINLTNYSVTYMGHSLDMPPKELELLYFLASQPNRVFCQPAAALFKRSLTGVYPYTPCFIRSTRAFTTGSGALKSLSAIHIGITSAG